MRHTRTMARCFSALAMVFIVVVLRDSDAPEFVRIAIDRRTLLHGDVSVTHSEGLRPHPSCDSRFGKNRRIWCIRLSTPMSFSYTARDWIMDQILREARSCAGQSPSDRVRAHADQLREALGLPAMAVGNRAPLIVGAKGEGKRKAPKQATPKTQPDPKRLQLANILIFPDEILVEIVVETLFPYGLLHMHQLRGRKETRSRIAFENALAREVEAHHQAYRGLEMLSRRFRTIQRDPRLRTTLYKKYMATPPEGLYEKPDPHSVVAPEDFADKVRLAPAAIRIVDGSLSPAWYRAFLTTVAYNEWQRAISLSTARAIQFLFWVHRTTPFDQTWSDFLAYWGVRSTRQQTTMKNLYATGSRATLVLGGAGFLERDFPLTFDTDNYLLFTKNAPWMESSESDDPEDLEYQSIRQPAIALMQRSPSEQLNIVPRSSDLGRIFARGKIDLVRLLQFRNTPGLVVLRMMPQWQGPGANPFALHPYEGVTIHLRPGEPLDTAALVVDPPYDMATDEEHPREHSLGGGFVPWASDVNLNLGGFPVDRITGMHEAVRRMRSGRARPDGQPTINVSRSPNIRIIAYQSGLSGFDWIQQSYTEPMDDALGPFPVSPPPHVEEQGGSPTQV